MRASMLADAGLPLSSWAGMGCWQLSRSSLEARLSHAWAAAETGRHASERAESMGCALSSSSRASSISVMSGLSSAGAPGTYVAAASSLSSMDAMSCACTSFICSSAQGGKSQHTY